MHLNPRSAIPHQAGYLPVYTQYGRSKIIDRDYSFPYDNWGNLSASFRTDALPQDENPQLDGDMN
jgi:hypothetical protein